MERSQYIGSSDAKDILSEDWLKMYNKKMGIDPEPDFSDHFPVQFGLASEQFHLDWTIRRLNEETGGKFKWSKDAKGEQHFSTLSFPAETGPDMILGSHPDALIHDQATYPVEAKLTGRFRNADEAADFYMPQMQHHMLCWGADRLLLSVVVGTAEPERVWVGFSQEWADHYTALCKRFWRYIATKTAPQPRFYDGPEQKLIVPTKVKDSVPINGMVKRSIQTSNYERALALEFIETKIQAARHEEVKKMLKEIMQPNEAELYCDELLMKRNKAGSILFTIKDKAAA